MIARPHEPANQKSHPAARMVSGTRWEWGRVLIGQIGSSDSSAACYGPAVDAARASVFTEQGLLRHACRFRVCPPALAEGRRGCQGPVWRHRMSPELSRLRCDPATPCTYGTEDLATR